MKSAYYTAVVTNTYKMAIDSYFSGEYSYDPAWLRELESVSHRDYHTGYYFTDSHTDANTTPNTGYLKDKAYLALATGTREGRAYFTQRNKMLNGDTGELLSPGKVGVQIKIEDLRDENGNEIPSTPHPYMTFSIKTPFEIKEGDIIRGL
jgi:putative protease